MQSPRIDSPLANRRLGQNFLCDRNMIQALSASLDLKPDDIVVEFCAGAGVLTKTLIGSVAQVYAVEIDDRMLAYLNDLNAAARSSTSTKVNIVHADALDYDLSALGSQVRVVGNLAYNISVPLLFRCLYQCAHIIDIHVMLQKEVADRLCANPGHKDYGRLAVVMQTWFAPHRLRKVPPECFSPRPQVHSTFVRLSPLQTPALSLARCQPFERFIQRAFSMRRKSLINNFRATLSAQQLSCLDLANIDPRVRAQDLKVGDFAKLFTQMEAAI